jgi:hypothetical protein
MAVSDTFSTDSEKYRTFGNSEFALTNNLFVTSQEPYEKAFRQTTQKIIPG